MSQLLLACHQLAPHQFQLVDLTPDELMTDYIDQLSYYQLSLIRGGKAVLVAQTDNVRKPWLIDTREFGVASPESGVYEIRLEAIGFPAGVRQLTNNFLRLATQPTDQVWVRRNGAYYDLTAEGEYQEGDWVWMARNTYDRYDQAQVRGIDHRIEQHEVLVEVIQEETYDNFTDPSVILAGSIQQVFCRTERINWAGLVHAQVRRWLDSEQRAPAVIGQNLTERLHEIDAHLTLLEDGFVADAMLATRLLRLIQSNLSQCQR